MPGKTYKLICPPDAWRTAVEIGQPGVDTLKEVAARLKLTWQLNADKVYVGLPRLAPAVPSTNITQHFTWAEAACSHCGTFGLNEPSIRVAAEKLEGLRVRIGKPINITSWYRCPVHNLAVGGVANSYHIQGRAVDIWARGVGLDAIVEGAKASGFGGIGIYRGAGFVHVDTGPYARWEG